MDNIQEHEETNSGHLVDEINSRGSSEYGVSDERSFGVYICPKSGLKWSHGVHDIDDKGLVDDFAPSYAQYRNARVDYNVVLTPRPNCNVRCHGFRLDNWKSARLWLWRAWKAPKRHVSLTGRPRLWNTQFHLESRVCNFVYIHVFLPSYFLFNSEIVVQLHLKRQSFDWKPKTAALLWWHPINRHRSISWIPHFRAAQCISPTRH